MDKQEIKPPIQFGIDWTQSSLPLPQRKEIEVDILNAVIQLSEAFGASNVEIDSVIDSPEGNGKVVTLSAIGELDTESIQATLRKAIDGFE